MPRLRALAALAFIACAAPAHSQEGLPPTVTRALAAAGIPLGSVAVVVQEVGAARAPLALNASASMNPASVMKLVTTYAALEQLGTPYRWRTEAHLDGALRDGVLEGNLVLKGGGDPKLNVESFWMLLRALRGRGLREIRGDLVIDRSYFERGGGDAARFDGDPFRPYNVLPDAMLVNFRSLRFTFMPDGAGGGVRIHVEPRPPALELVNVLKVSDGACQEGRAFRDLLKPSFEPARQRAIFAGRYPASCGEKDLNVALLEPDDHVGGVLRQLWSEMGGAWAGKVREGAAPAAAQPFHVHESQPLGEIVRDLNKFSNNVMARHVFLTLGAEHSGAPASAAKASAAIKAWLALKGIAAPELVIENGSGLSRDERISASSMAALLQAAWRSNVMPEFIASMPVAAVDGTMKRRNRGDGVAGNAHVKTGLLADVRSMAGFVLDRAGRRHVVVMFVNHSAAHQAQEAFDALLRWSHDRG